MDGKQRFLEIYDGKIGRRGAETLRNYLLDSDFFVAPASGRFHNCHRGGLCEHSVNVYEQLVRIADAEFGAERAEKFTDETLAICGLLHDVCKIDYYKEDFRNVKNENGEWERKPYYSKNEVLPYGHGEKSVYIINSFMQLTRAEALAINWHMGGFDVRVRGGDFSMSEAYSRYPLCALLHAADLLATYLDEERGA